MTANSFEHEGDDGARRNSASELTWEGWLDGAHEQIPQFCKQVFWGRGLWSMNRHALGWDLVRAPCNLFLAPIWILLQLCAYALQCCGAVRLAYTFRLCPPGLRTRAHLQIDKQLRSLLQRRRPPMNPDQQRAWDVGLLRYQASRQATAEILANLLVFLLGLGFFTKFTPGGLGLGRELAQQWYLAEHIERFWAGQALGAAWFAMFPPSTPTWFTLACVMTTLIGIALTSALAGFITDPVQYLLGCHQRRLRRVAGALHHSCVHHADNRYQPSEPWLARVFDALDWLRLGN